VQTVVQKQIILVQINVAVMLCHWC